jgi:hypothetical protein
MLTPEQIAHFDTFGFLVMEGLFSQTEVDAIRAESDDVHSRDRDGKAETVFQFFERSPFLTGLLEDERVYGLAESLLGPDFILMSTEGNRYGGETPWHSDGGTMPVPSIKVVWYLNPLRKDTGCLRVIPGSHQPGKFRDSLVSFLAEYGTDFGLSGPEITCRPLESEPGDVVVISEPVYHASFGGRPGRRMDAINFCQAVLTEEHKAGLREAYEGFTHVLHPAESLVNSDKPRLRAMVAKLVELGFETVKV